MKRRVFAALIAVLLAVGAFCAWRYYSDVYLPNKEITDGDRSHRELFERIKPDIGQPQQKTGGGTDQKTHQQDTVEPSEQEYAPYRELVVHNDESVGWLTIDGTAIDYPVVQTDDNTFYLEHGFDREYLYVGCPFLDYRCKSDFSGFNSIIYAHHLSGYPSMFTQITDYKDEEYLQSHPTGVLMTRKGVHTVRFFAYMIVPNPSFAFVTEIGTQKEKEKYIDDIYENAVYTAVYTSAELKKNTELRLLLLSTCTYEFEQARGVLAGVIE